MILADVSLRRPVLAVVISLLMLVFGLVSFQRLEVREMPETEKPVISIGCIERDRARPDPQSFFFSFF